MTQTTKRGRPAEYRNAAEKQKAYRERQKADAQRIELALALLAKLEEQEVTLRNSSADEVCYTSFAKIGGHERFQSMRRGQFHGMLDSLLFHLLQAKGALIEVRKDWTGTYYKLADKP